MEVISIGWRQFSSFLLQNQFPKGRGSRQAFCIPFELSFLLHWVCVPSPCSFWEQGVGLRVWVWAVLTHVGSKPTMRHPDIQMERNGVEIPGRSTPSFSLIFCQRKASAPRQKPFWDKTGGLSLPVSFSLSPTHPLHTFSLSIHVVQPFLNMVNSNHFKWNWKAKQKLSTIKYSLWQGQEITN